MYGDAGWRYGCQGSQADLSVPTQAPTRYAEVGNVVEVGDEEEVYYIVYVICYILCPNHEIACSELSRRFSITAR
jgi:hypothetical protein